MVWSWGQCLYQFYYNPLLGPEKEPSAILGLERAVRNTQCQEKMTWHLPEARCVLGVEGGGTQSSGRDRWLPHCFNLLPPKLACFAVAILPTILHLSELIGAIELSQPWMSETPLEGCCHHLPLNPTFKKYCTTLDQEVKNTPGCVGFIWFETSGGSRRMKLKSLGVSSKEFFKVH